MSIGRSKALDILDRWLAAKALLNCRIRSTVFKGRFRGRLFEVSDMDVRIVSDDTGCELVFLLDSVTDFAHGDDPPQGLMDRFGETVGFIFRLGEEDNDADFISLTEILQNAN